MQYYNSGLSNKTSSEKKGNIWVSGGITVSHRYWLHINTSLFISPKHPKTKIRLSLALYKKPTELSIDYFVSKVLESSSFANYYPRMANQCRNVECT